MNSWTSKDALAHHGILGQKWGKRNGPPYPLSDSAHSAAEKKAASTDKNKKLAKIGAIAVASVLASYGSYKLSTSSFMRSMVLSGMNTVSKRQSIEDALANSGPVIVKKTVDKAIIAHNGIKGQKWGVRNGPPYPLKKSDHSALEKMHETDNGDKLSDVKSSIGNKVSTSDEQKHTVVSGHRSTPKKAEPNSIEDHIDATGKVDSRTIYGDDGLLKTQFHLNNHGENDPKKPSGKNGEHAHDYSWNKDGSLKNKTTRIVTDEERKEHGDIL